MHAEQFRVWFPVSGIPVTETQSIKMYWIVDISLYKKKDQRQFLQKIFDSKMNR